ncbi:MAG: TonB-dependent receptor [Ghiorsea sp.]
MNPLNIKNIKTKAKIALLTGSLVFPMFAQTSQAATTATLDEIVVTAGRVAQNPADVSADVTVITRDEIENSQASTAADILRTQTAFNVASTGGVGAQTSVFIRGGNSGHTLVLIDGVRVGSATAGSFDWGNLSTTDIERIEIVRGPQSSLYGADAMGGVIQIFTRKGQLGTQANISAEAGSYNTKLLGGGVRGGYDSGFTYAINAEQLKTDGFSTAATGTEADGSKRTSLSGNLGFEIGDFTADINLRSVDATTSLDGYQFNPITFASNFVDFIGYESVSKQKVSSIKLSNQVSEQLESSLQYSRSTDESVVSGSSSSFDNYDSKTTVDQLTFLNHYSLDNTMILLGYDYHKDAAVSSSGYDENVVQKALFVSMNSHAEHSDWNVSVRKDNNSKSDNATTYKVGTTLHTSQAVSFSANLGTGFKAPTVNDLYYPGYSNPALLPEKNKSWDVGVHLETNTDNRQTSLSLIWFNQKYENLIAYDAATFSPGNVQNASSKGYEINLDYKAGWGFVAGNWTKLKATNNATGLWLARRAQRTASVTLGTDMAGVHAEIQTLFMGKRFDNASNTTSLDAYKKTDVRLGYAINNDWKLKLRVENLADAKYEEVSGYGVAGISYYAGVNATF